MDGTLDDLVLESRTKARGHMLTAVGYGGLAGVCMIGGGVFGTAIAAYGLLDNPDPDYRGIIVGSCLAALSYLAGKFFLRRATSKINAAEDAYLSIGRAPQNDAPARGSPSYAP